MASMCKLGFDIGLKEMAAEELEYCQLAVANWKRLQPVILDGVQYRLVSPYESNHMAVNYVSKMLRKGWYLHTTFILVSRKNCFL